MPDLSNLPAYLSIPFLLVFAVLLLVSRFLDVFDKWDTWSAKRAARKAADKKEIRTDVAEEVNETEIAPSSSKTPVVEEPGLPDLLSGKQVFGYAYVGAIAIPLIYSIVFFLFSPNEGLKQHHLYSIMTWMVYAAIAAFIIVYFRNKVSWLNQHILACLFAGYAVAGVVAIPVNMISTILAYSSF